jgi:molybdate transport system ATP-binding protein
VGAATVEDVGAPQRIEARFLVDRGDFRLDVDLALPERGISGLFGPSGSGKTTLLRAIAGLDRHPSGRLVIGGETWQSEERFVPPYRRSLGYVFQEPSLFPHLSVRGNLAYGLKRVPEDVRKVALDEAIDLLDIGPLLDRKPAGLSGGERQRVAIARSLAVSPGLLLMDEPLASLDRESKAEILPFLERLHDRLAMPVIYVSHRLEELARLVDHLVLLDAGRALASGAVGELLTRLDLPLAQSPEAAAIVEAEVAGHDADFHLTHLDFAGGRFSVPREDGVTGQRLRLWIAARDVSLTLAAQESTSIQNILPAVVDALTPAGPSQVTVRLLAGEVPLLARITHKSASELALAPGLRVYAQVKSVGLLG